jgi:hypothetical protein
MPFCQSCNSSMIIAAFTKRFLQNGIRVAPSGIVARDALDASKGIRRSVDANPPTTSLAQEVNLWQFSHRGIQASPSRITNRSMKSCSKSEKGILAINPDREIKTPKFSSGRRDMRRVPRHCSIEPPGCPPRPIARLKHVTAIAD